MVTMVTMMSMEMMMELNLRLESLAIGGSVWELPKELLFHSHSELDSGNEKVVDL